MADLPQSEGRQAARDLMFLDRLLKRVEPPTKDGEKPRLVPCDMTEYERGRLMLGVRPMIDAILDDPDAAEIVADLDAVMERRHGAG